MTYSKLLLVLSLIFSQGLYADDVEPEITTDELVGKLVGLQKKIGVKALYSTGQAQTLKVDMNSSTKDSVVGFFELLKENEATYDSLSLKEWMTLTDLLVSMDREQGGVLGWGNLLLKSLLHDYILSSIYVRSQTSNDTKELEYYLSQIQNLRFQMPTKLAFSYVAYEHYGFPRTPKIVT